MSLRDARELLKALTESLPPLGRTHHGLTLNDEGKLLVNISWGGGRWYSFMVEEKDLSKDPKALAEEIEQLLVQAELMPTQLGATQNPDLMQHHHDQCGAWHGRSCDCHISPNVVEKT